MNETRHNVAARDRGGTRRNEFELVAQIWKAKIGRKMDRKDGLIERIGRCGVSQKMADRWPAEKKGVPVNYKGAPADNCRVVGPTL